MIATPRPSIDRRTAIELLPAVRTSRGLQIGSLSVVESWEQPIQETIAARALATGGRILEVGYGLGMCARVIAEGAPVVHTVVEAHPVVAAWARDELRGSGSTVLACFWEEIFPQLQHADWDAIVFDAYPLDAQDFQGHPDEMLDLVIPALAPAALALSTGGRFFFLDFTRRLTLSERLRDAAGHLFSGGIEHTAVPLSIPSDCAYAHGPSGDVIALVK